MKFLSLLLSALLLQGCINVASFQPPTKYYKWRLHNMEKYFVNDNPHGVSEYYHRRERDMRACGIDPVIGESASAKANLCLEGKGWYLESGPVCEDRIMYDDPLCVKWRAQHKR